MHDESVTEAFTEILWLSVYIAQEVAVLFFFGIADFYDREYCDVSMFTVLSLCLKIMEYVKAPDSNIMV